MIGYKELLTARRGPEWTAPACLLAIDPGHTTGFSVWNNGDISFGMQTETVINRKGNNEGEIDWYALDQLLEDAMPNVVICEDYRVYAHKLERHTGSQILTLRIIGAIEYWCWLNRIPIYYQMASLAKGFVSDDKLKNWGFWDRGDKHSRDSMRHAIYWLLFNKEA